MLFLCEIIRKQNIDQGIRILECRNLDSLSVVPEEIEGLPVVELAPYIFSSHENYNAGTHQDAFWWTEDGGRLGDEASGQNWAQSAQQVGAQAAGPRSLRDILKDIPVLKGSRLKELRLPSTLKKVGAYAFYNCEMIKRMELYSTTLDWGAGAFTGCQGIEELVVHVDEDRKSCLKEVLAELRQTLMVEYLGKQRARLVFSEFFEEAVENTPARILSTSVHGCGLKYRNAFVKTQFQFKEYDTLFPHMQAQEPERLVARLALGRLRFPYQLAERYKLAYEQYLAEHCVAAACQAVERKDMEELTWLMDHVKYDGAQLESVIELAGKKNDSAAVSFLMDQKRKNGAVKRKRFQL